eukprot:m.549261 g.549261  ORF g.549261 m.549261 type:complete len:523 (-) comp57724_c1_seq5:59-1627(-)
MHTGLLALAACALVSMGAALQAEVQTAYGTVIGLPSAGGLAWLGIPFATPPVGPLRWKQALPAQPWDTPLLAQQFSAGCPQICTLPPGTCPESYSEDCLYLNIYAPANASNLPVLVFFPGGRYEQGGAGVPLYNGSFLAAAGNAIVVTTNYRLGVLGFLVVDGLEGNFGVLDQRLALLWVQQNIAAFGGDPNKVTISGQSAGGTSVAFHMVAEESWDLFNQAILESAPFALPLLDLKDVTIHGNMFATDANCPGAALDCLYNLSIPQILAAQKEAQNHIYLQHITSLFFPWTPHVDGVQLTAQPLQLLQEGKFKAVPVLIGDVSDEARMFIWDLSEKPLVYPECVALIDIIFRFHGPKVEEEYTIPHNFSNDCRVDIDPPASDYILVCASRNASNGMTKNYNAPVYRYFFDHAAEEYGAWGPNYTECEGHACHGIELPFVFHTDFAFHIHFSPDELVLTDAMMAYWGNFINSGNPNGPTVPNWPAHQTGDNQVLWIQSSGIVSTTDPRATYCDFWDHQGYSF